MLVNLSDVFISEGRRVNMEVPLEMTAFRNGTECFEIVEKTPISFTFTNIEVGKVKVEGNVRLTLLANCDRCLTETPVVLDLDFERCAVSPDVESEDADESSFMEDYQLDAETFVYNEISVSWPVKILCRDDCKGLCPKCGQNLNEGDCGCDTFVPDPRMAVIQDIFNASKEV